MKSVWQATAKLPEFPKLNGDVHTDVLIIGGGIAGILTAYFLQKSNVDYILVEKNKICCGTTHNTTAKITCQHSLIYSKIAKAYGCEFAEKYLSANQEAFDKYAELCRNIDCDYEVKDNFVYSTDNREKLEAEIRALEKIGYSAELCERIPLPFATVGAVRFKNQAQFNPMKFIKSVAVGLNIYENTFVREMIGNTAVTDNGRVFAKKVIVTTHFPFVNNHGSYFLKLYQHRSYMLGLENAQQLDGMYVDENRKGLSFRSYDKLLLLGGAGSRTGNPCGGWNELRLFAERYYPKSKEKFSWAAQDCMSLDGIPYIGQYSRHTPDFYVASGFNKWGMTSSMLAAMLLRDIILEKKNDFAEVFSPSRSIIKPQIIINGFEATKNLLTISKKRCSHLGCALKWNSAEHSWDCSCHGSRFTESGEVLDNPANGNLA